MTQRDNAALRDLRDPYKPGHRQDAEALVVESFAERDPIAATKALVHGLSHQTPGAQMAVLRLFAEGLVRRDPSIADDIARDLRELTA